MQGAAIPIKEFDRVRSSREVSLLDIAAVPQFDAILNAAALICGTPISLINLADMNRQWREANLCFNSFNSCGNWSFDASV